MKHMLPTLSSWQYAKNVARSFSADGDDVAAKECLTWLGLPWRLREALRDVKSDLWPLHK